MNTKYFDELEFLRDIDLKKTEGLQQYKQKNYQVASEKFAEVLLDIEFGREKNIKYESTIVKLDEFEIACRLNISQCSLNLGQYDLAINEGLKALKIKETAKAHYRIGQGYMQKQNYARAHHHFMLGINLLNDSMEVDACKTF